MTIASGSPGPGVDAQGRSAIDPTLNVKEKIEDTVRRLDDLSSARMGHHDEMETQRRYYEGLLREAEKGRRDAEKDRLDAIRIIDVTAVAARASEANERANTLATSQANQAEALRVQVANTATAFEAKLTNVIEPIQKDLAELRRSMYEGIGQKTQVAESRESAGDLKPILDSLSGLRTDLRDLQDVRQRSVGAVAQNVTAKDNTRFYIALAGGLIVALQIYSALKPGG